MNKKPKTEGKKERMKYPAQKLFLFPDNIYPMISSFLLCIGRKERIGQFVPFCVIQLKGDLDRGAKK